MDNQTLKIGPIAYAIQGGDEGHPELFENGQRYMGRSNHMQQLITLLNGMNEDMVRVILTHEAMHSIHNIYGLKGDEKHIHLLAVAVSQFLLENQWFLELFRVGQNENPVL